MVSQHLQDPLMCSEVLLHQRTATRLANLQDPESKAEKRLPCVLSRKEVYHILRNMETFHSFVFPAAVYSCGLNLQEALFLEVSGIDSHRTIAS